MNTHRRVLLNGVVVSLFVALSGAPALAEVSAEIDAFGNYLGTYIFCSASNRSINVWSVTEPKLGHHPLNPMGDLTGDLWPYVAENPHDGNHPWLAWSRFNGSDYDLVWSHWTAEGWSEVAWVEYGTLGDDLNPRIVFDIEGRPFMTWLEVNNGIREVHFSLFLVSQWMPAFRVSDPGEDCRDHSIELLSDGRIQVSYLTPDGRQVRILLFHRPDSINDDITPLGHITIQEAISLNK